MANSQKISLPLRESYIRAEDNTTADDDGVKTFADALRYYAETQGDRNAVVFASSNPAVFPRTCVTWSGLYEKTRAVAKALMSLGVRRHDVVAINIRASPEWLYVAYGATIMGAAVAPISFTYKDGSDLVALMKKLERCTLLVLDPGAEGENWDIVSKLIDTRTEEGRIQCSKMPTLRYLIGVRFPESVPRLKNVQDLLEDKHSAIELPELDPTDIAFIFQTSGSTGVPKLPAVCHKAMLIAHKLTEQFLLYRQDYVVFSDRPFAWTGGVPGAVLYGQTRVTVSGFEPPLGQNMARIKEIITEERCNVMFVLPSRFKAMLTEWKSMPADWPLEILAFGGQPFMKHVAQAIGLLCPTIMSLYGITEANYISTTMVSDPEKFVEYSCRDLVPGSGIEAKVIGENGDIVPVGERGELYVKSLALFSGYFNDPEKTAAVLTDDGWYRTDDLCSINENGELFVYGRVSNMIISGCMNVAPEILESVIKVCPGVQDVLIVPVPDVVYYQVLCACVVIQEGANVTEEDIRNYCSGVHNDKPGLFVVLPKFYMFMGSFPLLFSRKVDRKALARMAKDRFGK